MHDEPEPDDLMGRRGRRELAELRDPGHPRAELSPLVELEHSDAAVRVAAHDEHRMCFDSDAHPKDPHPREEGVTDPKGDRFVDMQRDTPNVDEEMAFDLTEEELMEVDLF